jgi:hypothetical protein
MRSEPARISVGDGEVSRDDLPGCDTFVVAMTITSASTIGSSKAYETAVRFRAAFD